MRPLYLISPLILQTIIWPGTRLCLWLFGSLKVRGLENLAGLDAKKAREHGVIFAVNHTSELDPILIPASLPFLSRFMPIFYTSREKSFYDESGKIQQMFYGGLFFKLWGSHAVKVGLQDYEKSLATHIQILAAGKSVLIFPEGGIDRKSTEVKVRPAKGGVAYLAIHCKSPIVPVAITGTYRFSVKQFFLRKRHIVVQFLPPVFPENIILQHTVAGEVNYTPAAQAIMDEIGKAVSATTARATPAKL
jgi:1-acyl-sn-glycerol-3-phosphate acyltransferase